MSITVAVNATDGTNGPQAAVCQSAAQHNNCGEYNGDGGSGDGGGIGIGGRVDDDDLAVFGLENNDRQPEQVRRDVVYRFRRDGPLDCGPLLLGSG